MLWGGDAPANGPGRALSVVMDRRFQSHLSRTFGTMTSLSPKGVPAPVSKRLFGLSDNRGASRPCTDAITDQDEAGERHVTVRQWATYRWHRVVRAPDFDRSFVWRLPMAFCPD